MAERPNRPADPDRVGELLERLFSKRAPVDQRILGAHDRVPMPPDELDDDELDVD